MMDTGLILRHVWNPIHAGGLKPQAQFMNVPYMFPVRNLYPDRIHSNYLHFKLHYFKTLQWRHNEHDGVLSRQSYYCLLNRLFRRRSKKTSKFRVTGLCKGNYPGPMNSPHKGPVTWKMFPFDDVIMRYSGTGYLWWFHISVWREMEWLHRQWWHLCLRILY